MEQVSIRKCGSYDGGEVKQAILKIFDDLGGIKKYVRPGDRVVLKPNLIIWKKPEESATTHPAVVKSVAEVVQDAGGIVLIAESPGGPYTRGMLKRVYHASGIEQAALETGAMLNYDLSVGAVNNDKGLYIKTLNILKPLIDADVVINLPKLKTHMMMVYTGAVKNMFGAVAGTAKADFHVRLKDYNQFANALIDIFLSTKTTINIMDAVVSMEGHGPTAGTPRKTGLILSSSNAFLLDYCACKIINLNPKAVPVLGQSMLRGIISENPEFQIIGEAIENVSIKDFDVPAISEVDRISSFDKGLFKYLRKFVRARPVIDEEMCTGCRNCIENCPPKAMKINQKNIPEIYYGDCIRCFCCHELCPSRAIEIKRNVVSRILMNKILAGRQYE